MDVCIIANCHQTVATTMTTTFTVVQGKGNLHIEAETYRFDPDGDLYFYPDEGESDPVAMVPGNWVMAVYRSDVAEHVPRDN